MTVEKCMLDAELSHEAVKTELERILTSAKFARARRLRSLLRFTVTQTLQGNAESLKEYVIGTEVLEKPDTYDPRNDSLVRVLANRLRGKLKDYYSNGGSNDPLVIEFPKGKYVPRFHRREHLEGELQKKLRARNACSFSGFLTTRLSEPVLKEAVARFEDAIESDPGFAPAHSGLATVYAFQAFLGFGRPKMLWPMVRAQAEAARVLDETSSEAHLSLGIVSAFLDHRWDEAEAHFRKAIERDTYCSAGHLWLALAVLIPSGKPLAAAHEFARAGELIPAPFLEEAEMLSLYFSGQYDELLSRTATPDDSTQSPGGRPWLTGWRPWLKSCALAGVGRLPEAIQALETSAEQTRQVTAMLGYLHGMAGQTEKAQQALSECATRREQGEWVGNYELALIHAGMANSNSSHRAEALGLLLEASRENEPWVVFLSVDPRFQALRSASDFVGLTETAAPKVFPISPRHPTMVHS